MLVARTSDGAYFQMHFYKSAKKVPLVDHVTNGSNPYYFSLVFDIAFATRFASRGLFKEFIGVKLRRIAGVKAERLKS